MAITTIHPVTSTVGKCIGYVKDDKIKNIDNEIIVTKTITSHLNCTDRNDHEQFYKHREFYFENGHSIRHRKDGKENLAFHLVQSFDSKFDPELANEIGRRLAEKVLSDYACVISTHSDGDYTHNHIVFNAYKMDGSGKWNDCNATKDLIRKESDRLCEEFGFSVIEEHRDYNPVYWKDKNGKNHTYEPSIRKQKLRESGSGDYNKLQEQFARTTEKKDTLVKKIKTDIDKTVTTATSFESLIQSLEKQGYSVNARKKDGSWRKNISYKHPSGGRPIRDYTLGDEYTRAKLADRISLEHSKDKMLSNERSLDVDLKSFVQGDLSAKKKLLDQFENASGKDKQVDDLKNQISENFAALDISEKYRITKLSNFKNHLLPLPNQFDALNLQLNNIQKMLMQPSGIHAFKSVDSELKRIHTKYDSMGVRFDDYFRFVKTLQRIDNENRNVHGAAFKNLEDSICKQLENIRNGKALLSSINESVASLDRDTEVLSECPSVMQLTTIAKMKSHPDYAAAKSGDKLAAYRLVNSLLSGKNQKRKIAELAKRYPDAILVAVHAEEQKGRNQIPTALIAAISEITGMDYESRIVQINRVGRTGSDQMHRLAHRPKFDGTVQAGRKYILVDDVVTGGGTLSELRCFIESKAGKVAHFLTAGAAQFSTNIALSNKTRLDLESKYGRIELEKFLKEYDLYGGKIKYLTESEGRAILGAGSLDTARDRIAKTRCGRYDSASKKSMEKRSSKKDR